MIKKTALNSLCVVNGVRLRKLYDSTTQPHLFLHEIRYQSVRANIVKVLSFRGDG